MMGQYILMLGESAEQIKRSYSIPYSQMSLSRENMDSGVHVNMAFIILECTGSFGHRTSCIYLYSKFCSSLFHKNCDKLCDG